MDFVVVNERLALEARDGRVEVAHVGGGDPLARVARARGAHVAELGVEAYERVLALLARRHAAARSRQDRLGAVAAGEGLGLRRLG